MSVSTQAKGRSGNALTAIIVALAALIIVALAALVGGGVFLLHRFNVASRSMMPTLAVGDYVLVSTFAHGHGYSLPFALFGRFLSADPRRGDIVAYRVPQNHSVTYMHRLVGLPGERLQIIDGVLTIDGHAVQREPIADYVGEDPCSFGAEARVKRWRETLPNGVSYETLECESSRTYDTTPSYLVPAGHFFMMADTRRNVVDSRVLAQIGYVPFDGLVGRAEAIVHSKSKAVTWTRL